MQCKVNGVWIDIEKTKRLQEEFSLLANNMCKEVCEELGVEQDELILNSPKQLGVLLDNKGYELPRTVKGNLSVTSKWLEQQEHGIFKKLQVYRKTTKSNSSFLKKIIDYQKVIPDKYKDGKTGRMFPTLHPYGAHATGRFSSGSHSKNCNELSIHQIPKRDEDFSAPLRELFIAPPGHRLIGADYSSQESRLQIHYAVVLGCSKGEEIAQQYIDKPDTDSHSYVAELTRLDRDQAKTINLGLAYVLGVQKLLEKLGLGEKEGRAVLAKYHKYMPFMRELQKITEKLFINNNYVETILGRKLYLYDKDKAYRALNKIIQGSAGEQCMEAMIKAHESGLMILFSVHDEIVICSKNENIEQDKIILVESMQNAIQLKLPMWVEAKSGDNWRQTK
jgi:DNA polymerase I